MLTLYLSPGSSSMAPHIALQEIGVPFEHRVLSFARKEHGQPAYLAVNPDGKVPALLIDGRLLTEVAGIMFYLAKRHPEARLMPDDIEAQAQVVSWMSFLAATVHPARPKGIEHATKIFGLADQRLRSGPWTVGDQYSIADIHLFRLFWRFAGSLKPAKGTFPNLEAHHDRMLQRPAVAKTIAIETAMGYELP